MKTTLWASICLLWSTTAFVGGFPTQHPGIRRSARMDAPSWSSLGAKKKPTKKKKASGGGGGFGGASMEPCPCGSGDTYSRCCAKLHQDVNAYKSATAEQVVRARYSAFSKKQPDFLMATTHPLNKDFDTDLRRWKENIKQNMYDNFDLQKCHIVKEAYEDDDRATVTFVAEMVLKQTGEVTGFQETSIFERAKTHGGWLYMNGTMAEAPEELLVRNIGNED